MKYQLIYADPPWDYGYGEDPVTTEKQGIGHYPRMTIQEIQNLPVIDWVTDDAALFLWTTPANDFIAQCQMNIMPSWGFKPKYIMHWIKENKDKGTPYFGAGYHIRSNVEYLLYGVRGHVRPDYTPSCVQYAYKEDVHSRKPYKFRKIIEQMFPNFTKLELFARKQAPGWDTWGNECRCDVLLTQTTASLVVSY